MKKSDKYVVLGAWVYSNYKNQIRTGNGVYRPGLGIIGFIKLLMVTSFVFYMIAPIFSGDLSFMVSFWALFLTVPFVPFFCYQLIKLYFKANYHNNQNKY